MRTYLECQVLGCQHYCDSRCSLPEIKVEGPDALDSFQTQCDSFQRKVGSRGENVAADGCMPTAEASIRCSARHCGFNHGDRCHASRVCVSTRESDVSTRSGTECRSFSPAL